MIINVLLRTPPPLAPMDPLLIACGAACLISAPVRFWKARKGLDPGFNIWGGLADIIIGVLVILSAVYW